MNKHELSASQKRAIEWFAILPYVADGGYGQQKGLVIKPAPADLFEIVFDEGNLLAGEFWDTYAKHPVETLELVREIQKEMDKGDSLTGLLRMVMKRYPRSKRAVQFQHVKDMVGMRRRQNESPAEFQLRETAFEETLTTLRKRIKKGNKNRDVPRNNA